MINAVTIKSVVHYGGDWQQKLLGGFIAEREISSTILVLTATISFPQSIASRICSLNLSSSVEEFLFQAKRFTSVTRGLD